MLRSLAVALISTAVSVAAAAADLPKVKFLGTSATVEPYHGFMYLGIPLGYYKVLGIDFEFTPVAGDNTALQLLGTNAGQLAYIGLDSFILAKAKHPELPVIAVYLQDRGNIYEVAVPEDSPIKSVADLKDKIVGVANLASGAVPNLKAMLAEAGLDPNSSVGLVPIGYGAQAAAALRSGRVQAVALFRAQHALLETLGFKFRYFTRKAPSAAIMVNTDFLKQHPDAVVAALKGIIMGSTFAEANPAAAVREHWKMFGKPAGLTDEQAMERGTHVLDSTDKMWKDYQDKSVKWGDMDAALWDAKQQFLIDQKLLDAKVPNDILFTTELIGKINDVDTDAVAKQAKGM
jgi:NitT/TauT family transport system substrate-binding protein